MTRGSCRGGGSVPYPRLTPSQLSSGSYLPARTASRTRDPSSSKTRDTFRPLTAEHSTYGMSYTSANRCASSVRTCRWEGQGRVW